MYVHVKREKCHVTLVSLMWCLSVMTKPLLILRVRVQNLDRGRFLITQNIFQLIFLYQNAIDNLEWHLREH